MRKKSIVFLCHLYPIFISYHLLFGNWLIKGQLFFTLIPILIFASLFFIWNNTSNYKLLNIERISIGYLVITILTSAFYYCLCACSTYKWVYNSNIVFSLYVSVTFLYYIYTYNSEFS